MAYLAWGEERAERTVVCVHGLTGNARDFDALAQALVARGHFVVCPDVVGRGASDPLADPEGYGLRQYVADMRCLLEQLDADRVDWVGTSMGGLIGMTVAGASESPVRRLVINDIGPFVPSAALQRLDAHLGTDPSFEDLAAAELWLRQVRAPFGRLSDEQWRQMTERSVRRDGRRYRLHYDPAVAGPFRRTADRDVDVWETWDLIACPVLVLRGQHSDLLLAETAAEMATRGPKAEVVEVTGCGHAPALLDADQIEPILVWLGAAAP
ncbi:MAG TPA: alpha/beta hydrolase [Longimicrobiales bacterium]|nr:alpha/beta hydrolase [Longimicrobiales bacterium]